MEWIQALVAALVATTVVLAIRIGHPAECSSAQQKQQRPHLELWSQQSQQEQEEDDGKSRCYPALFSFGSSVADTGTQPIALPLQPSQNPPYGSTYFGKPANRYSDGRINIDFWGGSSTFSPYSAWLASFVGSFLVLSDSYYQLPCNLK
jgi:hypothetical protein